MRGADREALYNEIIASVLESEDFSKDSILTVAKGCEANYLSHPLLEFTVQSSVMVQFPKRTERRDLRGVHLSIRPRAVKKYALGSDIPQRAEAIGLVVRKPVSEAPTQVLFYVSSRTPAAAAQAADEAFDLLRGIWTLALTKGSIRLLSEPAAPVGLFLPGPLQTVHDRATGELSTPWFWYERAHLRSNHRYLRLTSTTLKELAQSEKCVLSQLSTLRPRYRKEIEDGFRRYAKALDELDYDITILRLWNLMEALTNTSYAGYDSLVKRASSIFRDSERATEELECVRFRRNQLVHREHEDSDSDPERVSYILKNYVDELFLFHLREGRDFSSLAEAAEFLELTSRAAGLKRHHLYEKYLRFVSN